MPRLGRRSAGSRVQARAQQLSDDLLAVEEATFAAIVRRFETRAAASERLIRAAWTRNRKSVADVRNDARLRRDLSALHVLALHESSADVAHLADESLSMALAAIGEELQWCEETMAAKYAGTAAAAVAYAASASDGYRQALLHVHTQTMEAASQEFSRQLTAQLSFAVQAADDVDQVVARVCSATPVNRKGISGRGIWWRATSWLTESARGVSIGGMNGVRTTAVAGFNQVGALR